MRDASLHVKILSLASLVGILYWRDFVALWHVALSVGWIGFTLTILSAVFVFLYQRREALKTLVIISESKSGRGAFFLFIAVTVYIFGSYFYYTLWLHLLSLVFFIIAYSFLRLDFRIPKILFAPLVALLFLVPPPIETSLPGKWGISSSITILVVVIFVAYIIKNSRWWNLFGARTSKDLKTTEDVEGCPICKSNEVKDEAFCPYCGRQRSQPKSKPMKLDLVNFFILLLIAVILTFGFIPTLSFTDQKASITFYTSHGREDQPFFQTPEGWILGSSERLFNYEKRYHEDFVISNIYVSEIYPENKLYIILEIGPGNPYVLESWQNLPGWRLIYNDQVPLIKNFWGQYIVLQQQNNSMTILCWTMNLIFNTNSAFSAKNVGVSMFMNFTNPVSESKMFEVLDELTKIGIPIIEEWNSVGQWSLRASTLNEIYLRFRDVFLTVVSVMGVFFIAGWARAKDEGVNRLTEKAFLLSGDEALLLVAISMVKRRKSTGAAIFAAYEQVTKNDEDVHQFYEKLNHLFQLGLVKKDYDLRNSELIMVWKTKLPLISRIFV